MRSSSAKVFEHQIPGGQYSNLMVQCKSMGLWNRWNDVLDMYVSTYDEPTRNPSLYCILVVYDEPTRNPSLYCILVVYEMKYDY